MDTPFKGIYLCTRQTNAQSTHQSKSCNGKKKMATTFVFYKSIVIAGFQILEFAEYKVVPTTPIRADVVMSGL